MGRLGQAGTGEEGTDKEKGENDMNGESMFGKCDVCGKEATLERTYYHYDIKCECHSPNHFEIVDHCKGCKPKEPRETKILFSTEKLKASKDITVDADKLEHLLNCMCNQKFIHEQSAKTQKEWQEIIDKAYHEVRGLLCNWARERRNKE